MAREAKYAAGRPPQVNNTAMSSRIVLVCGSTTVKSILGSGVFLVYKICGWLKSHSQSACFLSVFSLSFEDYASLQCKSCDRIHYCLRHDGWAYFGYAMCAGRRGSWQGKGESLSSVHHRPSPCLPAKLGVISPFTQVNHFGFEPLLTK